MRFRNEELDHFEFDSPVGILGEDFIKDGGSWEVEVWGIDWRWDMEISE